MLVDNLWGSTPFIFLAWGDEVLLRSVNFCRDFDSDDVLNTDRNNPLTSFEAFLGSVSIILCTLPLEVSNPYKSCYMLKSTELLSVTTDASLADFLTGYCAYLSNTPNLGAWVMLTRGSYFGIPHFEFMNGWAKICSNVYLLLGSTTRIFLIKSFAYWSLKDSGKSNWPFDILWYVFYTAAVSKGAFPINIRYIITPVLQMSTS